AAAVQGPPEQVADEQAGPLDDAGLAVDAEAVEQVADGRPDRPQDPRPPDPAAERLPQVGLEDGPVRQQADVAGRGRRGGGVHALPRIRASRFVVAPEGRPSVARGEAVRTPGPGSVKMG